MWEVPSKQAHGGSVVTGPDGEARGRQRARPALAPHRSATPLR